LASQDEGIQTLTRLGLTLCQAKVYIALVRSGESTARTISNVSKVPREHVYRVTSKLQELGLVEKAIEVPAMYIAIPMKRAFSILMEHRLKETCELQAKTREVIKNFGNTNAEKTFRKEGHQFILIPNKGRIIQRRNMQHAKVQTSVDGIFPLKEFANALHQFADIIKETLKRGVKIRVITEKPEDKNSFPEIIRAFEKNPYFQVRYILKHPSVLLTVYDKKEVIITTSATAGLIESPSLWSNNPSLLTLAINHFEAMWTKALENEY